VEPEWEMRKASSVVVVVVVVASVFEALEAFVAVAAVAAAVVASGVAGVVVVVAADRTVGCRIRSHDPDVGLPPARRPLLHDVLSSALCENGT